MSFPRSPNVIAGREKLPARPYYFRQEHRPESRPNLHEGSILAIHVALERMPAQIGPRPRFDPLSRSRVLQRLFEFGSVALTEPNCLNRGNIPALFSRPVIAKSAPAAPLPNESGYVKILAGRKSGHFSRQHHENKMDDCNGFVLLKTGASDSNAGS